MARNFTTVGVIGLGTMGAGIAEVFARHGLDVVAVELDPDALARGRGHVEKSTGRAVGRGKLSVDDQQALLGRMTFATTLEALAEVTLVIEAVPERLEIKRSLFASLDAICPPSAILATNTSSLSITQIATATARPGQVVGMHFFNPAPVMKLVEVVHSVLTDAEVISDVRGLAERLGKTAVSVGDRAGFVANRLLFGYLNQAANLVDSAGASREDVDTAMTVGAGLPMGPLALLDLIGLDTSVQVLDAIYDESRDRRHAAAPILRQLVAAGFLGRKTGRGIYDYASDQPSSANAASDFRLGIVTDDSTPTYPDTAVVAGPGQLDLLADCTVIIDAVGGGADDVRTRFAELGRVASDDAVLVTTSTSVSVLDCAAAAGRLAQVVGLRRHDEVNGKTLAEVVGTVATADGVVDTVVAVAQSLGLTPVRSVDRAGGIVDALLFPHLNDAVRMIEDGYASADDVDAAMRFGCGYPAGPIALLERIGLGPVLAGLEAIYAEQREPGLAPAALLRQLVNAGRLHALGAANVR